MITSAGPAVDSIEIRQTLESRWCRDRSPTDPAIRLHRAIFGAGVSIRYPDDQPGDDETDDAALEQAPCRYTSRRPGGPNPIRPVRITAATADQ